MKLRALATKACNGFTLLEVLIAGGLFFIALFSILELSSRSLNAARNLSPTHADISEAVLDIVMLNRFTDEHLGFTNSAFENFPDHSWQREIALAGTNGWFQINYQIMRGGSIESQCSIYMYKPASRITYSSF